MQVEISASNARGTWLSGYFSEIRDNPDATKIRHTQKRAQKKGHKNAYQSKCVYVKTVSSVYSLKERLLYVCGKLGEIYKSDKSARLGSLGDLDGVGGTKSALQLTVDGELTSGDRTNHDETGGQTTKETPDTEFTCKLGDTAGDGLTGGSLGLVDLGEQRVGGLRDGSGGETSDKTGTEVEHGSFTTGEFGLGLAVSRDGLLEDDLHGGELGHVVRDLLEQDGTETGVESTETLLAGDAEESGGETVGESGLRNETDTGSLEGTKGDIGEELGNGGSTKVDSHAVVDGGLVVHLRNENLLEEFVTTELESTLKEVTEDSGAETGKEGTGTFLGNDLTETADHTLVVDGGLKLDTGLDDIDGGDGTVGEGAV